MKKVGVLSLLLILFVVTIIANNPLASALSDLTGSDEPSPLSQSVPVDGQESKALIPSPSLMLLIGSGLVGLIIYRKKYKDRK
jgi:hypothetical protein